MKLFLDRNKTLLPRVDSIYLLTRVLALTGIGCWGWLEEQTAFDPYLFWVVLGTFSLHLAVFFAAIRGRFDIKLAYLSAIIYDIILVPTVVLHTGGIDSPFSLLFFLTTAVAAYVLRFWVASSVTLVVALTYLGAISQTVSGENLFGAAIYIGFLLVFFLTLSYASDHLRRSEKRLLGLFDTLNRRTSELERSHAQLEIIYENSRIAASILDTDGVVKEVMRILGNVLQYPHAFMILEDKSGRLYYRARLTSGRCNFHPKAIGSDRMELVRKICRLGEPVRVRDIAGRDDYQPLGEGVRSIMVVPMSSRGQITGVLAAESDRVGHFTERDIQLLSIVTRSAALALENAELHKRTEELTIVDELTETYNYRYFLQKLQEEKRRAVRYNLPLSLIMIDIDRFKKLNDTYGHESGNSVLRELSVIIRDCIRDVDIFVRYGGEEFAVILPQTPLREASVLGERIRERVEAAVMDAGQVGRLRITVSVGVSSFPENGRSEEELVSVADQALYRAKGEGRNLVRVI
ncbi:MAG: sensor domain-containing diguanylate cyclase [bacterium]